MNTIAIICVTCFAIAVIALITAIACWLLAYTRFMSRRRSSLLTIIIIVGAIAVVSTFTAIVSVFLLLIAHSTAATARPVLSSLSSLLLT